MWLSNVSYKGYMSNTTKVKSQIFQSTIDVIPTAFVPLRNFHAVGGNVDLFTVVLIECIGDRLLSASDILVVDKIVTKGTHCLSAQERASVCEALLRMRKTRSKKRRAGAMSFSSLLDILKT